MCIEELFDVYAKDPTNDPPVIYDINGKAQRPTDLRTNVQMLANPNVYFYPIQGTNALAHLSTNAIRVPLAILGGLENPLLFRPENQHLLEHHPQFNIKMPKQPIIKGIQPRSRQNQDIIFEAVNPRPMPPLRSRTMRQIPLALPLRDIVSRRLYQRLLLANEEEELLAELESLNQTEQPRNESLAKRQQREALKEPREASPIRVRPPQQVLLQQQQQQLNQQQPQPLGNNNREPTYINSMHEIISTIQAPLPTETITSGLPTITNSNTSNDYNDHPYRRLLNNNNRVSPTSLHRHIILEPTTPITRPPSPPILPISPPTAIPDSQQTASPMDLSMATSQITPTSPQFEPSFHRILASLPSPLTRPLVSATNIDTQLRQQLSTPPPTRSPISRSNSNNSHSSSTLPKAPIARHKTLPPMVHRTAAQVQRQRMHNSSTQDNPPAQPTKLPPSATSQNLLYQYKEPPPVTQELKTNVQQQQPTQPHAQLQRPT